MELGLPHEQGIEAERRQRPSLRPTQKHTAHSSAWFVGSGDPGVRSQVFCRTLSKKDFRAAASAKSAILWRPADHLSGGSPSVSWAGEYDPKQRQ